MSRHVATNIPSARTTVKSAVSTSSRPTTATAMGFSRAADAGFVDHNLLDASRKEIIHQEQDARRAWTAKFNPWLVDEYRQMYDKIAEVHGVSRENSVISLKRQEWQQPVNVFPPLHKRLIGQRRRRLLGAFPETENDKIGWRALPQQNLEIYKRAQTAHINPLPRKYKFSQWPIESFY